MFILTFNRSMFYIDINRLKKTNRFILTFIIILCTLSTWICHAVLYYVSVKLPKHQQKYSTLYVENSTLDVENCDRRTKRPRDRRTDRPTDRPTKLGTEAPCPELKLSL